MEVFAKKQYLSVSIGVLVVLAIGYFRCKPLVAKAQDLQRIKADQSLASLEIKSSMETIPKITERMDELNERIGDYRKKVPEARDFAGLWDQIAAVMKRHGLSDQLIQPDEEILGKEINSILITIKCSGSFEQLYEFLGDLEKFERVIRIEQLKFINSNEVPGVVTMDAKAKIYYQFEDQELVKVSL